MTVSVSAPWPSFELGFQVDVELQPFVRDALQLFQSRLARFRA